VNLKISLLKLSNVTGLDLDIERLKNYEKTSEVKKENSKHG